LLSAKNNVSFSEDEGQGGNDEREALLPPSENRGMYSIFDGQMAQVIRGLLLV